MEIRQQSRSLTRFSESPLLQYPIIASTGLSNTYSIKTVSVPRISKYEQSSKSRKIISTDYSNLIRIKCKTRQNQDRIIKCGFLNIRSLSSKAVLVNDLITEHNIDLFGLAETWLRKDDFVFSYKIIN